MKLEQITKEAQLLGEHRIDTAGQLSSYKGELEARIDELTEQRRELYRKQRTEPSQEMKAEISLLSGELKRLRQEVKLCENIAVRSGVIEERIQTIREDEEQRREEENQHEQFRGRSRTNR